MTTASLPYRADIQGLRAIAILLVVLAHAGVTVFSGGFVGVDLFFVLSGYLITGLLVREYETHKAIRLGAFFSRRLKRLLPSLLTVLCLVILLAPIVLTNYEVTKQSASASYAATWTSNLFFALSNLDYFAELQTRDLFLHTWSLGVEEQFYLLWPVLLLFTFKLLACRFSAASHLRYLLAVLGLLFAGSLALCWYWALAQPRWSFYLMPSRIWQFSLGAAVFVSLHARSAEGDATPVLPRAWSLICGAVGLIMIVGSAVLLHPDLTYPGCWALVPSLGAAMVIAAGHGTASQGVAKVLGHPALVWVGDRSYSLYLWHWPVLTLGFAWGMHRHPSQTMGLVALSMMLAILTYRLVEQPFWKGRFSFAAPARTILMSVLAMVVVVVGSNSYLRATLVAKARVPQGNSLACVAASYLSPAMAARIDTPALYAQGCDAGYLSKEIVPCVFGPGDAPRTAVLLGDSVGTQWFSLLPEIFKTPDWRIVVLTKSACAMVDEDYYYRRIKKTYTVCTEWRNGVLDYLDSLKPDVVFLGSAAGYNFSEAQWTDGSSRVLARLTASARNVVVIPGTPSMSFDGPACLERLEGSSTHPSGSEGSTCVEALASTQPAEVARYLDRAVQRFPNARLLDLNDLVCPGGYCAARNTDGITVFRDAQHLTDSFVRAQVPEVLDRLQRLGLEPIRPVYTSRAEDHHGH